MKDLTILLGEGVDELTRFRRVRLAASPGTRDAEFAGDGGDRFAGNNALGDRVAGALTAAAHSAGAAAAAGRWREADVGGVDSSELHTW